MIKKALCFSSMLTTALIVGGVTAVTTAPQEVSAMTSSRRGLARITGTVRDTRGNPLAGAFVSLLRDGAESVVKQTKSGPDGSFSTWVAPGRYALRAVAEGFNTTVFSAVQVSPAAELIYRFNLEPVGRNRTLPELRSDRNDPKWRLRSANNRRSIFHLQGQDGSLSGEEADATDEAEQVAADPIPAEERSGRSTHGIIETYAAGKSAFAPAHAGINFAVATSPSKNLDVVLAGQLSDNSLQRLEATVGRRIGDRHRVSLGFGGAQALVANNDLAFEKLEQFALRGVDEWQVRDGVVVVLGLDYARFLGAVQSSSFSPRLGIQFDANAHTRLRAAYAPGGDEAAVQSVHEFEGQPVIFKDATRQPLARQADGSVAIEQSRRLEMGIERVLDNNSSVEATAFFDTTDGRGIGLFRLPLSAFPNENGQGLLTLANQQGAARGMRVVYARRLNAAVQASAGYSFGHGQQLAPEGITQPDALLRNRFFQSVAAQLDSIFGSGTRVRTVFRFSPRATVFAIDPFAGRLAVYDPGLSILVTQELPTFGLPVRAEAVIDGRNLLDAQTSVDDGETLMYVGALRRSVRGGISLRF